VASAALVPQSDVDLLTRAYRAYRATAHHLALAGRPALIPAEEFARERADVTRLWDAAMAADAPAGPV
jgi:glutamate-ammonia-ligase adenylyltransferase